MKITHEHLKVLRAVVDGRQEAIDRSVAEQLVGARFMRRLSDANYEILPKGRKVMLAGEAKREPA